MENIVIAVVLLLIIGLAVWYVVKAKKSGKKCIGCPSGSNCSSGCGNCAGCGNTAHK